MEWNWHDIWKQGLERDFTLHLAVKEKNTYIENCIVLLFYFLFVLYRFSGILRSCKDTHMFLLSSSIS